jgi:rhodanese-related sulfurtransferase
MQAVIPVWDLLGWLGSDEVVVVDCRGDEEWLRWPVQIPGALRMRLVEILEAPWILPDDELIVLYDGTGTSPTLRRAFQILSLAGRTPATLEGGLLAWLAAGFPTERRGRPISEQTSDEPQLLAAEGPG